MFLPFVGVLFPFVAVMLGIAAAQAQEPAGATLLTIAGAVEEPNRGPFDPFRDGFLKFHEKSLDKALELDRATLESLEQKAISANAEGWPAPVKLEGPLLTDVLALAGAEGKPVTLFALDGYGVQMTAEQVAARDWVLALKADGSPLGIGGRGPLWLAYDTGGNKATADEEGAWVWSVFYVEVAE